jgi:hypothetical protein
MNKVALEEGEQAQDDSLNYLLEAPKVVPKKEEEEVKQGETPTMSGDESTTLFCIDISGSMGITVGYGEPLN